MTARAAQVSESQQNQIHAAFTCIAKETINGFARRFFLFAFHEAGEEMKAHMIRNDRFEASDLIVAKVKGSGAFCRNQCPFDLVFEETDPI